MPTVTITEQLNAITQEVADYLIENYEGMDFFTLAGNWELIRDKLWVDRDVTRKLVHVHLPLMRFVDKVCVVLGLEVRSACTVTEQTVLIDFEKVPHGN